MKTAHQPENDFHFLSELVLAGFDSPASADRIPEIARHMNPDKFEAILDLATKNHVVIRAFSRLSEALKVTGRADLAERISLATEEENSRIRQAIGFLARICTTLEQNGCFVTVNPACDAPLRYPVVLS